MIVIQDAFKDYIQSVSSKFLHAETSELGYRTDFENLLKKVFESINVRRIDHDPRAKERNKPDFVLLNYDIPILYIETKDIGTSLDKVEKSEQMARYYGYTNLVLTDYLEFRFYRNGLRYGEPIKIADYDMKRRTVMPVPDNYEYVAKTLLDFTKSHKEPIRSGKHLSKIMGGKAQRIRDNVRQFLSTESDKNIELVRVYETIKKLLVHDLTQDAFADMYAQTLVYGLFAARYHDESQESFSRQEARDLIPNSNPLLRHFFDHIVGPNFDKRLEFIVNELCEVFSHANVQELMKEYFKVDLWGQTHSDPDPVIHFYEDFLKEYDPELRKKMGAYYTPLPVVQFIVRAVDYLLKKEFGLSEGIADTSKTAGGLHRVQILDPAVGTGTFISNIIRNIYEHLRQTGQEGRWHPYVLHDLLPRLHGFELMMTPYTIAHLKLSMAFRETGFKYFNNRRLGIYLTNSLEESTTQEGLFTAFGLAESIAEESKEASKIKNERPIMVIVGNPPYSVSSSNKGVWIQNLIKDYKKDLHEKKTNLDDDYIKFIRFAEHFIEKNGNGIVAMITNNSFIDGITHRQMRKHLLETFDDIYIYDLHGNSKKKEKAPSGGKDENIFEIQQGVAISIFVRGMGEKKVFGSVHHAELYGKKESKFKELNEIDMQNIQWKRLNYSEPHYFFVPKDFRLIEEYQKGFGLTDLSATYGPGVKTERDFICIKDNIDELKSIVSDFENLDEKELTVKYRLYDSRDWKVAKAKKDILTHSGQNLYTKIQYRPFDYRWMWYSGESKGFIGTPGKKIGANLLQSNIALITSRTVYGNYEWNDIFITKTIVEFGIMATRIGNTAPVLPLYLYSEDGTRIPNLKKEIVDEIEKIVGKVFPEDIFDYIYAVLHSPNYREKYKEFLKIDFPRVPYPKNAKSFKKLVVYGAELRLLHLLESPKVNKFITTYPIAGSNSIEKVEYKDGKVFINKEQYFGGVPELAWNFYVGGYQPAQKWLKDRKGRELTNEDIEHYQKIIVALIETDKLMKKIDQ